MGRPTEQSFTQPAPQALRARIPIDTEDIIQRIRQHRRERTQAGRDALNALNPAPELRLQPQENMAGEDPNHTDRIQILLRLSEAGNNLENANQQANLITARSNISVPMESSSDEDEPEPKQKSAPQEKKGFKRSRMDFSTNHTVYLGYDARAFLRKDALERRKGILLSPEAQQWAKEFRQNIVMTGDTGPMGTGMDREPQRTGHWRRVGRGRRPNTVPVVTRMETSNSQGTAAREETEEDREVREQEEEANRLEEEVRIEQEIYEEFNMQIPNYMNDISMARIRAALDQLTEILAAHVDTSLANRNQTLRIHFSSEQDLQAEVWRVLNGIRPTSPLLRRGSGPFDLQEDALMDGMMVDDAGPEEVHDI